MSAIAAISGLGMTEMTRTFTKPARSLAVDAILAATADAGLEPADIDGLLINRSPVADPGTLSLGLQHDAGLSNLRLLNVLDGEGSSALQMIQFAALAVRERMATHVVCVFADDPLSDGQSAGAAFAAGPDLTGGEGLEAAYGSFGWVTPYAMVTRRHMGLYGTKPEALGTIAVDTRRWATLNDKAVSRVPITLDAYFQSPWIADPLRILDCARPVNGAIAVVVTSEDRARDLRQPPVHVLGMGQGHTGNPLLVDSRPDLTTGALLAGRTAYAMAGVSPGDIDMCQFYDAFTIVTLLSLEDYGFCEKGEGGEFVLGDHLPVNTSGGHLSGYYMQGMTPLSEAVLQARGQAGARQCPRRDLILVTGQGGVLDFHSCLILSPRT